MSWPCGSLKSNSPGLMADVAAKGLQLAVEVDEQLVVLNALHAGDADDGAIDVGVIHLSAKGPAGAVVAAAQRMEESGEGSEDQVLYRGQVCAVVRDDLGRDLDFAIDRTDDIDLRGEQAMRIEISADRLECGLVRDRVGQVRVGNDDDGDDAGYLTAGKVRMIERQSEGTGDVGAGGLRGEVDEVIAGDGAITTLQG